jgi:hypothetical protein
MQEAVGCSEAAKELTCRTNVDLFHFSRPFRTADSESAARRGDEDRDPHWVMILDDCDSHTPQGALIGLIAGFDHP